MITKTKLVKRIFSSLLTAALAVPMTASHCPCNRGGFLLSA